MSKTLPEISIATCRVCPFAIQDVVYYDGAPGTPQYRFPSWVCRQASTVIPDLDEQPDFCPLPITLTKGAPNE